MTKTPTINKHQFGFSLVELLVSMLLGLILMAGVLQVMVDSTRTSGRIRESGEVADAGRYIVSLLREEIALAGFYGQLDDYDTGATSQPNPCSVTQANLESGMTYPLGGIDSVNVDQSIYGACSWYYSTPKSDTDMLVIRRASTSYLESTASLNATKYYLQATPTSYVLDLGSNAASFNLTQKDGTTPARIHEYYQTLYYVGWNDTLYRVRLSRSSIASTYWEPIAGGVEDFQVEYGIDRSGNGSPNADGGDPAWVEQPTDTEWDDVVSVRFYVLLRTNRTTTETDTKTYSYADKTITPNSRYNHGVFSSAVQISNIANRRFVQ